MRAEWLSCYATTSKAGELMPTFETPPGWWVSLANLLQWLNWDAIGAVGSAGALLVAIKLADQSNRDSRRREAAMLTAVLYPIATWHFSYPLVLAEIEAGKITPSAGIAKLTQGDVRERMIEIAETFRVYELPSTLTIDHYASSLSIMKQMPFYAERARSLPEENSLQLLRWQTSYFETACRDIALQARMLGARSSQFEDSLVRQWLDHQTVLNAASLRSFPAWVGKAWSRLFSARSPSQRES